MNTRSSARYQLDFFRGSKRHRNGPRSNVSPHLVPCSPSESGNVNLVPLLLRSALHERTPFLAGRTPPLLGASRLPSRCTEPRENGASIVLGPRDEHSRTTPSHLRSIVSEPSGSPQVSSFREWSAPTKSVPSGPTGRLRAPRGTALLSLAMPGRPRVRNFSAGRRHVNLPSPNRSLGPRVPLDLPSPFVRRTWIVLSRLA